MSLLNKVINGGDDLKLYGRITSIAQLAIVLMLAIALFTKKR